MIVKVRCRYDIGTPIIKKFNEIPYNGNVISNNGLLHIIKYKDGDEEELTHLIKFVQQANKISLAKGYFIIHIIYLYSKKKVNPKEPLIQ